jgi:endonuclease/exonuclease/phosphatase family metal-dependent hydrolase
VRVATWNAQHGLRPDGVVDIELVGRTVASLDADVVAIQELDVRTRRAERVDQAGAVASVARLRHVYAAGRRLGWLGRFGVGLFSRGAIDDVEVLRLPGDRRRRIAVLARTSGVSVAAMHLSRRRSESAHQLGVVLDALLARPGPHLALGDLNRRDHEVDVLLARGFTVAGGPPTYPAAAPLLRIDHVAAVGMAIVSVDVPSVAVSDHRPLVVELR